MQSVERQWGGSRGTAEMVVARKETSMVVVVSFILDDGMIV